MIPAFLDQADDNARADTERAISAMVRLFYDRGLKDPDIGPIFGAIPDLESHLVKISDFWSRVLLGTGRYRGQPFPPHVPLRLEPRHFDSWLALFEASARECLRPDHAAHVVGRAYHMANAFRAGLFPLTGPDGRRIRA